MDSHSLWTGHVEPAVATSFRGCGWTGWLTLPARRRRSPPPLVLRLRELSNRYRGAGVVAMRTQPIPRAYRSFFRQIGLDPDVDRIPSERAAVARLLQGGFRPIDLISDACLLALLETGVPVWALDAAVVDEGGLGVRTGRASGDPGPARSPGSLVVADRRDGPRAAVRRPAGRARGGSPDRACDPVRAERRGRAGDPRRGGACGSAWTSCAGPLPPTRPQPRRQPSC